MPYATTYSNFIGSIAIPNLVDTRADGQLITTLIEQYENDYLETLLGYDLAQEVITEIDTAPVIEPYASIVNGATYTDANGDVQKWHGFVAGKSPIANYIYCEYLKIKEVQTTNIGSVKQQSENATMGDGSMMLVRAWNDMCAWNMNLHNYITSIKDTYPTELEDYIGFKYAPELYPYYRAGLKPNQLLFIPQNAFSL